MLGSRVRSPPVRPLAWKNVRGGVFRTANDFWPKVEKRDNGDLGVIATVKRSCLGGEKKNGEMRMSLSVTEYLQRIGYGGGTEPTVGNLVALVRAHRLAVPYETLDLWRGHHVELTVESLYGKIVVRRRGGYCFELNGLFSWLLRELGYNVREYFGRWHLNETLAVPKRRHRVICVALPGRPNCLVDVGISLPLMTAPLELAFDKVQANGRNYCRVVRDPSLSCVVEIRRRDGAWVRLFSFDTAPQLPIDFDYAHYWCETHPTSVFRRQLWVCLPKADGSIKTIGQEDDAASGEKRLVYAFTPATGPQEKTVLGDEAALAGALKTHFGLVE